MVGAARCEVLDVGGQENAGDIVAVCLEVGDWDEGCLLAVLKEMPDVDVALYILAQLPP